MMTLLHIEDNDDDAFLLAEAFRREGIPHRFHRATNGAEGLNYLMGMESYADRAAYPLPDLVITDFHMPVMDGIAFLRALKETPLAGTMATLALTSCKCEADIETARQLGALECLDKPASIDQWRAVVVRAYDIYGRFKQGQALPATRSIAAT